MTDRPTPDPRDDLPAPDAAFQVASARHDGEATDAEGAGLDEAAIRAHGEAIAAVAGRVADVGGPPAGSVDEHIAAALAAFDDEHEEGTPADQPAGARVASLDARRPWWQRAPLGAVAAAVAVVALVGAIGFAAVGDGDGTDDTATAALDSADSAEGAEEEAFRSDGGGAASSGLSAEERERFASYDELAAALGAQMGARGSAEAADEPTAQVESDELTPAAPNASVPDDDAASGGTSGAAGCDAIGVAGIDPSTVELVRSVVVEDQLVTAVVHGTGEGRRLTSVDEATCTVTDERDL